MRYLVLTLVLAVGLACAPKSANLSPAGQAAFTADQVVVRLGELQDAAITANQDGSLDKATANAIVRFTVDGAKTCKAAPAGWQDTVRAGWAALKGALAETVKTRLKIVLAAVDALIGA